MKAPQPPEAAKTFVVTLDPTRDMNGNSAALRLPVSVTFSYHVEFQNGVRTVVDQAGTLAGLSASATLPATLCKQLWDGTSKTAAVVSVKVAWTAGVVETIKEPVSAGRLCTLRQPAGLFVAEASRAAAQAAAWATSDPAGAALMRKMAQMPTALWVGDWTSDPFATVKAFVDAATAKSQVGAVVLYAIPDRDCGGLSAGGLTFDGYKQFVRSVASAVGTTKTTVIVEPGSLALSDCLSPAAKTARLAALRDAVAVLTMSNTAMVYLDGGTAGWRSASDIAALLKDAGVGKARGFALNVSNFKATRDLVVFGDSVVKALGGGTYVLDVSRNGLGPSEPAEWCNPKGRAVGVEPTFATASPYADAYLWVKTPGNSDGLCNGGPKAGDWWPAIAKELAANAWG